MDDNVQIRNKMRPIRKRSIVYLFLNDKLKILSWIRKPFD